MASEGTIRVGTSGWQYSDWKGRFYPENARNSEELAYYARHFGTVEINNTFYSLPEESTVNKWHDAVPGDFVFAVKASRYLTHMKKLKDPEEPLDRLYHSIEPLEDRVGPVLFQLPPNWKRDHERLESLLDVVSTSYRNVFEFRHPDWFHDEIFDLLREHGAAFCIYDMSGRESPHEVTADFVYIRMHGPESAYQGSYSKKLLSGWAGACSSWARSGLDVYVYFNNDHEGHAVRDAQKLIEMVGTGDG